MRLVEEKNEVKLNVIMIIFILFTAVLSNLSDYFINKRNSAQASTMMAMVQSELFKLGHLNRLHYYQMVGGHNFVVFPKYKTPDDHENPYVYEHLDKEKSEIKGLFKDGKIEHKEYIRRLVDYHGQKVEENAGYHNKLNEKLDLLYMPSIWMTIKQISNAFQLIGTIILGIGYWKLHASISGRVSKKRD